MINLPRLSIYQFRSEKRKNSEMHRERTRTAHVTMGHTFRVLSTKKKDAHISAMNGKRHFEPQQASGIRKKKEPTHRSHGT